MWITQVQSGGQQVNYQDFSKVSEIPPKDEGDENINSLIYTVHAHKCTYDTIIYYITKVSQRYPYPLFGLALKHSN